MSGTHLVEIVTHKEDLSGGDLLFLVSCQQLIESSIRGRYRASLVLHASDLPLGRGMSPHVWQILEGANSLKVTLLSAEDQLDSGDIWLQSEIHLQGHELFDEINQKLFDEEILLMDRAVNRFDQIQPRPQDSREPTWYARRTSKDSCIDVDMSLRSQFNLLRVCDPERFPAFFDLNGYRYQISIRKSSVEAE